MGCTNKDKQMKFNDWLADKITDKVGTMYCAYLFSVVGITGMIAAFTNNVKLVLIIGAFSGYFLQLVLLPIIMVGQKLQSNKHNDTIKHLREIHKHLGVKK